jgi:hypothetical protein
MYNPGMQSPPIIAFVGLAFTGKSTSELLTEEILDEKGVSWEKVYFGGHVVDEVKRRDDAQEWAPELRSYTQQQKERYIRELMREEHGLGAMAKLSTPQIDAAIGSGKAVLIDDLYSEEEREILVAKYGLNRLQLVALTADWEVRVRRAEHRPQRSLNEKELFERDEAEIRNLHKAPPIARAHVTILNNANELEDKDAALETLRRELENRVIPKVLPAT